MLDKSNLKSFLGLFVLQSQSSYNTMPKKGKKKAKATRYDLDTDILPKMEIIYKDTKSVTGVEPKFKWGHIYQMIKDQTIPDVGLEDIPLYVNIRKYAITKAL